MSYQVEISFHPINELINSLHAFLCKKWYKRIDLGQSWPIEVKSELSAEVADELDRTEISLEWKLVYLLAYVTPQKDSIPGFLAWLQGLSPGEIYEALAPYVQTFPENLGGTRDRLCYHLTEWNKQYFQQTDAKIVSRLQEETRDKQSLAGLSPFELAEKLTNGLCFEPAEGFEKLVLVPQYHFQPGNIIYSFGSLTLCQYSAGLEDPGPDDEPSLKLYRMLRSLSEKSRLRILRFLRDEPRSFIEVVRHLGISKGITHEHIFNLRCAGLLNAHIIGESVSTYSLRTGGIHQVQEELLAYLEEKPLE